MLTNFSTIIKKGTTRRRNVFKRICKLYCARRVSTRALPTCIYIYRPTTGVRAEDTVDVIYFLISIIGRGTTGGRGENTRYRRPTGHNIAVPKFVSPYTVVKNNHLYRRLYICMCVCVVWRVRINGLAKAFILFRASFITIQSTGTYLSRPFRLRRL